MEVKLDKRYPLDVDPARAWSVLRDLKAVAGCMPGAELTEQLSETSYKGGVKVKVGPAVAQFGGTVDVLEKHDAAQKMVLRGKGTDKGGSSASMELIAVIEPDPASPVHSVLHGEATVTVNGKFAQFGGRLMVQVSDMILVQFVENFRRTALALPATASATAAPAVASAPPKAAGEINGLAIIWVLIKNWWFGLFGKRV
ncbi:MAG: SRPBCC family protein [Burkholderiales bacterium]|nr:SRPBCC family protein [Burkholderiales bacterium]